MVVKIAKKGYFEFMLRNPDVTRAALLAAARDEFAALGIAGARVDSIAARSGVSKQRIYGHFTNKEGLFDAVLSEYLDNFASSAEMTPSDPVAYVGQVFDCHRKDPTLLRLMLWEALHYTDRPVPDETERAGRYREKVSAMARDAGLPDADAAILVLILIGMAAWPSAVPQLRRLIFSSEQVSDAEYGRH